MMEPKLGITFVTGGARSGKSAYAVELGKRSGGPVVYLATAEPIDDEMRARIARHQAERPAEWRTIEEPLELAHRVEDEVEPGATVIVDCMTVWLGNVLEQHDQKEPTLDAANVYALGEVERLGRLAVDRQLSLIAISNEVGGGIVPADPLTRSYRDLLGEVNQRLASMAETVVLLVSGIPVDLRSISMKREANR